MVQRTAGRPAAPNRLSAMRFVLVFGAVSALSDFVYESARSAIGPYLATLGASGALVGSVTGLGEAVALGLRVFTGRWADRWRRHWTQTAIGYAITVVSVPLLALATPVWAAALLFNAERFGKAVRTPSRDTMLAQAATEMGRGRAFGIHMALDSIGAFGGPLVVALVLALGGGYRTAFAVLAVPGALALGTLALLRRAAPDPAAYEHGGEVAPRRLELAGRLPTTFWAYSAFSALTMVGFATYAVLAFHLQVRHVVAEPLIPVLYAVAMAGAAVAALGFGRFYDRKGLRGLAAVPILAAVVPFLSFSATPALVWAGAVVWGLALGVHESTMRAAVADLVPAHRRGAGYGTFTAIYGLAWLAGSAVIGVLYDVSPHAATAFIVGVQAAALVAYGVLLSVIRRTGR